MTKDSMAATLRRMIAGENVRSGVTVHGFRATFRTWAAEERMDVPEAVAEACLSHVVSDKVVKAYNRAQFMALRSELLESWAQYLETTPDA